jgi:polyvinyl alcohol dehydrogenase (cytochrome)
MSQIRRRQILIAVFAVFAAQLAYAQSQRSTQQEAAPPDGAALYRERCATCHDRPTTRVPPRAVIASASVDQIIQTLTTGGMKAQARGLRASQIRAIAAHLSSAPASSVASGTNSSCQTNAGPLSLDAPQWNGWGRDLDNSRYQPQPGLDPADVPKLKVKWAFAYPSTRTWGQPTIVGNRVYVTSQAGHVYSLDARTGCIHWELRFPEPVRTALSVGPLPAGSAARFAAYFGDVKAFVHAVDAETGKQLWKARVDEHPMARITGAPTLHEGRLYVPVSSIEEVPARNDSYECCKFRGAIAALDAHTGKVLWKAHTIREPLLPFKKNGVGTQQYGPAGAAVWSAPTLDPKRRLIYVGTGNSYTDAATTGADAIIAFDMDTGEIKWGSQVTPNDNFIVNCEMGITGNCPTEPGPDVDFGASPVLRTLPGGKQVLLGGQKSGVVWAFDPDNGKVIWKAAVGEGSALGGVEWGHAADEQHVYAPISDVIPRGKRRPGFAALKLATGEQVWHVPTPAPVCNWGTTRCVAGQSAAVTVIPGVVFSGALDGHLRAYATKDGAILWDFDTAQEWEAVNGGKAKGGSLDVGGPTIAGGMLYVNSGYGVFFGQLGNVLLAFSVDGR